MALVLVIVALFLIFAYKRQKSIVSPFFLVTLAMMMSLVLILINTKNWAVVIYDKFILCIAIALTSWLLGSSLYLLIGQSKNASMKAGGIEIRKFEIPKVFVVKYPYYLMTILCGGLMFLFVYKIIQNIDLSMGFRNILREIYTQKITSSSGNFIIHQVDKIIVTIAYISFLQLMLLVFSHHQIKNKKLKICALLATMLLGFVTILIGTDRNVFIRYAIYCICLFIFFYMNNYTKTPKLRSLYSKDKLNASVTLKVGIVGIILVIMFYFMGKAKNYTSDFSRMIGIYAGSGLYNFNLYINGDIDYTNGASTFKSILGLMAYFGIANPTIVEDLPLIVVETDGYVYASNIYSTLQPFYADFGIAGIVLFTFVMGFFFEWLFAFARRGGICNKVFYSAFIYPTVYFPIADQFFARVHLGLAYEIFWLWLFLYVLYVLKERIYYNKIRRIKIKQYQNGVSQPQAC